MSFKIAIIGAGSVGFTRKLFTDILCVPEFADIEVALTDISQHNLDMIETILNRTVAANRLPTKITATTDRRKAIEGARYVISCVRVGGLDAYADDIRIPLKYGVDQCVGDTICAGGILYGQRNIPVILDFCRDIRELAEPGAKFLNYANPMAMNTWAAIEYGKVDTIGLCHGVQHGADQIAEVLGAQRSELDYVCSGINHQTWFIDVRVRGRRIGKDELVAAFEAHPVYSRQEKLRIDVLKRFGVYSTESNGHLSEYLPWYRKRPDEIARWIDMSDWIHGETGGYLRHSTETRNWFEAEYPKLLEAAVEADRSRRPLQRACQPHTGGAGDRPRLSRHFNVRNDGVITNLPPDAIVESPGFVDRFGINMAAGITLAGSLRRDLHGVDQRPAHVGSCRHFRRSRSAEARRAARSAGRRHLHARGSLADGRRDGGRPGRVAAAICACDRRRPRPAEPRHGQDARMEGRGEPPGAPARGDPRRADEGRGVVVRTSRRR